MVSGYNTTQPPAVGHMKAAHYALHYIHSRHNYGISFTSALVALMHCYAHFPPSADAEAHSNAIPPTPATSSTLPSYSNACWGYQIGSAVTDGTILPLFNFWSMNGDFVFWYGRPLGWLCNRQEQTSLSSTNAKSKKNVDFRHLCTSMCEAGHSLPDATQRTLLYNDNEACIKWSHNMTSEAPRHIKLREKNKSTAVKHVSGKINPLRSFFY